jgi:SPX domain protein involved in polyphosphate accumulation
MQTVMTSSTMYAEFVACYEAVQQAMWLKKFVSDLRVVDSIERPLKLYYDNEPTVLYAHNKKKMKAAKNINIRFYVAKEKIQDQTISLEHISTKKMIVDLLTKGLPTSVFREHLVGMGLRESL